LRGLTLCSLAALVLVVSSGASAMAGGPVLSTSSYVAGPTVGAQSFLTTCPVLVDGERCTDTVIGAIGPVGKPSPQPTVSLLQVTYDVVNGGFFIVSGIAGTGRATTLYVDPLLAAASAMGRIDDLTFCDGNLQCGPGGSATVAAQWNATGELTGTLPSGYRDAFNTFINAGFFESRRASVSASIDGITVPGVNRSGAIFRGTNVHVCVSVFPDGCGS